MLDPRNMHKHIMKYNWSKIIYQASINSVNQRDKRERHDLHGKTPMWGNIHISWCLYSSGKLQYYKRGNPHMDDLA
jgi:hypothetical protein